MSSEIYRLRIIYYCNSLPSVERPVSSRKVWLRSKDNSLEGRLESDHVQSYYFHSIHVVEM